jgi:hypothetical protein
MTITKSKAALASAILVPVAIFVVLYLMQRPLICACGTIKLWHGVVQSSENSQHLSDWYTFSHIIHGFLFYALGWTISIRFPKFRPWALALALLIEGGWEILENTPMVIDRYRSVTVSWGYTGDSIVNSMADMAWMSLGFWVASRLNWRVTAVIAVVFELFTLYTIRDNLTLNVLMLVAPVETIAEWQAGA